MANRVHTVALTEEQRALLRQQERASDATDEA
jgi:hypothetical protein